MNPTPFLLGMRPVMRLIALACLLVGGCSPAVVHVAGNNDGTADAPLSGRILDTRTNRYVDQDEVIRRAVASRYVILGEAHDNAIHHRLQYEVLEALIRGGRAPALAMEQFDREHQSALDAARASGKQDVEQLADSGHFDRKGWRWPDYKPLVQLAVTHQLPLLAANFSRDDARALMKSGAPAEGVSAATTEVRAALEKDIVEGHCGFRPSAPVLTGMVEAQRARDAHMARTLDRTGPRGAVLIAGAGHARRDRGAPAYLPDSATDQVLSVAFIEVEEGASAPLAEYRGLFDLVWFTPRAPREDPCKSFRVPKAGAPAN